MPKKNITLETPFKRGEKVMLVNPIAGHVQGQRGKVKLVSGFDEWKRYWVRFADGDLVGSVDHSDLVRPAMYDEWLAREEDRLAQEASAAEPATEAAEVTAGGGGTSGIPEHLLERSRAAKARLTGG